MSDMYRVQMRIGRRFAVDGVVRDVLPGEVVTVSTELGAALVATAAAVRVDAPPIADLLRDHANITPKPPTGKPRTVIRLSSEAQGMMRRALPGRGVTPVLPRRF